MDLPKDFTDLMRQQYGDEMAENLFEGLSAEPCVSIRLNPKKSPLICPEGETREGGINGDRLHLLNEATAVPWCPDAFYLPERPAFTFDPLFHAGVYYVQEASSMYLAEVLRKHLFAGDYVPPPGTALDLCAAPGGKSTLLRSVLPDAWLLVSNEPMPKRAQVLAENMIKWGYPNCVVTQNYPADFAPLVHQFDLLVTDVPCSGEGMFRKDEGAIRDWSLENVDICWRRQRDILTDIWPTLRPGGLLVYSTCTFNHLEDEDNVEWIASHLGADILEQRHFFPGRDAGEGFFIAALRKNDDGEITQSDTDPLKLTNKLRHALHVLHDGIPAPTQKGASEHGKKNTSDYKGKNAPRPGKQGTSVHGKKNDSVLIPSHTQAMSTDHLADDTYPSCELTYQEALAYLRHEVLRIEAPLGIVRVTFKGIPLGFVKNIGNRANNLYPQEWRIRTTYTTPFCLFDE